MASLGPTRRKLLRPVPPPPQARVTSDADVERAIGGMAGQYDRLNQAISRAEGETTKDVAGMVPRAPERPTAFDRFEARVAKVDEQIRTLRTRSGGSPDAAGAQSLESARTRIRAELERLEGVVAMLSTQLDGAIANAEEWRRQAEAAVLAEDDDIARKALVRAKEYDRLTSHLRHEIEIATRVMAELRAALASTDPEASG